MKNFFTKSVYSILDGLLFVAVVVFIFSYYYLKSNIEYRKEIAVPVVEISYTAKDVQNPYKKDYDFTEDWFIQNIPIWEKVLAPFAGKADIHYLEIGVFEGRAAVWMLENILTHASSHLTGIDLFTGDYEGRFPKFGERYHANISKTGAADRTTTIQGYSQVELRKLPLDSFHIIYIDGSHENRDVLEDAILSMRLLKSNGILIFDDYNRHSLSFGAPRQGIDVFVRYYGKDFDVLHNDYQVVLRKK
jgi:hypothetical protein